MIRRRDFHQNNSQKATDKNTSDNIPANQKKNMPKNRWAYDMVIKQQKQIKDRLSDRYN